MIKNSKKNNKEMVLYQNKLKIKLINSIPNSKIVNKQLKIQQLNQLRILILNKILYNKILHNNHKMYLMRKKLNCEIIPCKILFI